MKVWIVCIPGFEGDFEPIAAFSDMDKARDYIESKGFRSWSLDDLTVDNPEAE
ncbi:hypothetical protein [Xenorhabdus hominickii]|uniref:Uncharacterized protein n=1 Tax=Xenorhabdus hominickii TaxID=351679 RepID=A0A2G0QBF1_XENHO|nr:hypothetical protein [Xenorhabdus hominickii]PHM56536.1 hypothetical protein Xhom_02029 [Xenorhabdus hominickii]